MKCPFICKETALADSADSSEFCLRKDGHKLSLKHDHAYYYQVQLQLLVCEASYCDFVVWSEDELYIERVLSDKPFIDTVVEAA